MVDEEPLETMSLKDDPHGRIQRSPASALDHQYGNMCGAQ
jgi:hypothetical protein